MEMVEIKQRVQQELESIEELKLGLLYGSAVTGRMHARSDIDVAVSFDKTMSTRRRFELKQQLEGALRYSVDLVDLTTVSGTILQQILCNSSLLLCRDRALYERLAQRMIYNQADLMPAVVRTLKERQERFLYG